MVQAEHIQLHKSESYELGAHPIKGGCHFAFAHEAKEIRLHLYENEKEPPVLTLTLDQSFKTGDVFSVNVTGYDLKDYRYVYEVEHQFLVDPYATKIRGCRSLGKCPGQYYGVIGEDRFNWGNDMHPNIPAHEMILYKLHVRNFTKSRTADVEHKGTFAGLAEKIPYLKSLGINAVEWMPAYEFKDYEEGAHPNYWGYATGYYFAPKAAYTSCYADNNYTVEIKQTIKAFHKAGIEVIMEFYFPQETSPVLMVDVLRYWKKTYHIDGAHLYCEDRMNAVVASDPYLKDLKLFYPYWPQETAGHNLYEYHEGFSQVARRLLKGDEDQMQEFLNRFRANSMRCGIVNYITSNNGFTLMDLVSYDRKHNDENGEYNRDGMDYNLSWNHGVEGPTRSRKILALRNKSRKNAMAMLLLAQGIPMIYAGDEFGNSQNGNNNAYCLDNETSWVNWNGRKKDAEFFDFVKELIAFRKSNPVLHMDHETYMTDYKNHGLPDISYHGIKAWYPELMHYIRHSGVLLCGRYGAQEDNIYVGFNLHWEDHELGLPKVAARKWQFALATEGSFDRKAQLQWQLSVPARSVVVLKDTKNS